MNKKAFTLVELLLVIVIVGIIGAMTIPSIMDAYNESRRKGGETVEDILIENLKIYNKDNEIDLWDSSETGEVQTSIVSINTLYTKNPDIDMGECLLKDNNSLVITKNTNGNYTYTAKIICSKDFKNTSKKTAVTNDLSNANIYYDSDEK